MEVRAPYLKRVWILTVAAVIAIAIVAGIIMFVTRGPNGAESPGATADAYLSALRDDDAKALEEIADPDHESAQEIKNRLARLGGDKLSGATFSIGSTESDANKPVQITGILDGQPYSETLWLYRHGKRWFVALGPQRNAHPKGTARAMSDQE